MSRCSTASCAEVYGRILRPLPSSDPRILLAVASGGALGSLLRWSAEVALPAGEGGLPWATLAVNVLGSAVLGVVVGVLDRGQPRPALRGFLATGLVAGFTTFSTYAVQVALLAGGAPAVGALYAVLTPVLCVTAAWAAATASRPARGSTA